MSTSSSSSSSKGNGGASGKPPKKARKSNGQPKSKKASKICDTSVETTPEEEPLNEDSKFDDISTKTDLEGERSTKADSELPNETLVPAPPSEDESPFSITSSSDSQWQPVSAGRIRKSGRPKKELHNRPPLIFGSTDTPNVPFGKLGEREKIDDEDLHELEEFNAHISEKIHRITTHRGGVAPLGMMRGIQKNVLVER